jgi:hypothetical protein
LSGVHLFFDQNLTAFRWILRAGGQPYLSKPVGPAKETNSKSHFVALAALKAGSALAPVCSCSHRSIRGSRDNKCQVLQFSQPARRHCRRY